MDISHVCVCVCVCVGGGVALLPFFSGSWFLSFFLFFSFFFPFFFFGAQIFLKSSVTLLPHLTLSFHSFSFLFGIKAFLLMSSSSSFFFLLRGEKKKEKKEEKKKNINGASLSLSSSLLSTYGWIQHDTGSGSCSSHPRSVFIWRAFIPGENRKDKLLKAE